MIPRPKFDRETMVRYATVFLTVLMAAGPQWTPGACPWALTVQQAVLMLGAAALADIPIGKYFVPWLICWGLALLVRFPIDVWTHNPSGGNWNGWKYVGAAAPLFAVMAWRATWSDSPTAHKEKKGDKDE